MQKYIILMKDFENERKKACRFMPVSHFCQPTNKSWGEVAKPTNEQALSGDCRQPGPRPRLARRRVGELK